MVFLVVAALTVILVGALLWNYKRTYSVWSKQGVNGPTPLPVTGNFHRVFWNGPHEVDEEDYLTYGNICGQYTGKTPVLMLKDADLIRQITIKDAHIFTDRSAMKVPDKVFKKLLSVLTGDEWKKARKVVSPTFSTGKLKHMYKLMDMCANEAIEAFEEHSKNNREVDLKQFWGHYTLNVIARCCFATDVNAFKEPNSEFLKHVKEFFRPQLLKMLIGFSLPHKIVVFLERFFKTGSSTEFFFNVTEHLLKQRRQGDKNYPTDYLQLLMDAKEDAEKEDPKLAELLDDNFIKAQTLLFFVAGYETTAILLTFAGHVLATNPPIQDALYEVLSNINRQEDGSVNYEDLVSCKYLDAFISETLRRYPPAVRLERCASEDYVIPGHNICVPKGANVGFSPWSVHHDPRYYSDPHDFKPERFLPENAASLYPNTYIPFGSGPRNCVAMRFALLEAKTVIAKTLLEYEFVQCPRTDVPIKFVKGTMFLTAENAIVGVRKRQK